MHAELEALRMPKEEQKKRTETLAPSVPSIAVAARWVADLGGYVGPRSAAPTTIDLARGARVR